MVILTRKIVSQELSLSSSISTEELVSLTENVEGELTSSSLAAFDLPLDLLESHGSLRMTFVVGCTLVLS